MTFFGPPKKIQKMRSHSLQPSSQQFVGPFLSSFSERNARWNLQLDSRFPNRTKNNDRSDRVYTCAESRTRRSFRNLIRNYNREIRKIEFENKARNAWSLITTGLNLRLDLSNLISWNRLSRKNAATRQETMTTCPALVYYYDRQTQKYTIYPT